MLARYDAIVIGGGVVGASAAYHLAASGAKTLLVDRADAGRATDAGAGILAPETSGLGLPDAWFNFGVEAVAYYPTLIQKLAQEQAGDTGYAVCGKLTVAVSEDEREAFAAAQARIAARQQQRGLPRPEDLQEVTSDEAQRMFPALAPTLGALYYRKAARVDGRLLAAALLNAARSHGLAVLNTGADRLEIKGGSATGAQADGVVYKADHIIIAGGAWSTAFGAQLGVHIPVEPQRGQIMHLHLPDADTGNWPIITPFHEHYIVCWPGGRVVAGATRETGSGFHPVTSAAGMHEVLTEALRVAPGLAKAEFNEIRVGLRPYTRDGLPVLGTVPGTEGVYLATGHGASGLQLGPYSGKLAADWAAGQPSSVDISAFHISRFNNSPTK